MKIKNWVMVLGLLMLVCLISGCGTDKKGTVTGTKYYNPQTGENKNTENTEDKEKDQEVDAVFGADLYMVVSNDMTAEHLILKQMASGKQYLYYYSLTTSFLDKYGNSVSVTEFNPGRIITIGEKDSQGKLKKVQISDKVWEYEEVVRYEIDEERGIFQIADTKYSFDEDLLVVSDEKKIKLSDIGELDELRLIGMNKEILSVSVTTGHGVISVKNTDIFEGSFIQVGRKIFAEITGEFSMEVPEGNYMVTVANKGYGGSKEITVERDETTVIDLDELKGEGPKKGKISFVIADEEENQLHATLKIDGKTVSYADALELDYGIHSIQASAPGFEVFSKKLFVNSEQAEIKIALSEEKTKQEVTASTTSDSGTQSNLSENNTSVDSTSELSEELVSDYLSTLTELLGNIYN